MDTQRERSNEERILSEMSECENCGAIYPCVKCGGVEVVRQRVIELLTNAVVRRRTELFDKFGQEISRSRSDPSNRRSGIERQSNR